MRKLFFRYSIAWTIAIIFCLIWVVLYTSGAFNVQEPAKISNLATGYQVNGSLYFSNSGQKLNLYSVCGNLDDLKPKKFVIILQNLEGTKSFGENKVGEIIKPGYFCSEIKITETLVIGKYKFVFYDKRNIIGEIEFEITE